MAVFDSERAAAIPASVKVLELGCGQKKIVAHSTSVDLNVRSRADVIHDLNQKPYPFADDSFDIVIAEHVLEHLENVIAAIEEVHRISRPDALFYVEVPHFSSAEFFTDPTHRHSFSSRSFDYFVPGTDLHSFRYSEATFRKRRTEICGHNHRVEGWINRHLPLYERRLAFLYPASVIRFELQAIKGSTRDP
jgi:SAM-dependent methyltransferase